MLKKFLTACMLLCLLFGANFGCSSPEAVVIDQSKKDLVLSNGEDGKFSPHDGGVQIE